MKIILCGYGYAGCLALEKLIYKSTSLYVYSHDHAPEVPSLIDYANKLDVGYTTKKINIESLPFVPDVICSIYYRYRIEQDLISMVSGKAFNLHPSLLPHYRGCGSITWAMINGETHTGFTYHYLNENFDSGNILIQVSVPIRPFDTQSSLTCKLVNNALDYFDDAFDMVVNGYVGEPQMGIPSYYKRGTPYGGNINEDWDNERISRYIRAMVNPPLPYAKYNNHEVQSYEQYLQLKNKTA